MLSVAGTRNLWTGCNELMRGDGAVNELGRAFFLMGNCQVSFPYYPIPRSSEPH